MLPSSACHSLTPPSRLVTQTSCIVNQTSCIVTPTIGGVPSTLHHPALSLRRQEESPTPSTTHLNRQHVEANSNCIFRDASFVSMSITHSTIPHCHSDPPRRRGVPAQLISFSFTSLKSTITPIHPLHYPYLILQTPYYHL